MNILNNEKIKGRLVPQMTKNRGLPFGDLRAVSFCPTGFREGERAVVRPPLKE